MENPKRGRSAWHACKAAVSEALAMGILALNFVARDFEKPKMAICAFCQYAPKNGYKYEGLIMDGAGNTKMGKTEWQIAQINIGRLLAPHGDARVQPFFDALDRINAMADGAPGFVWRLQSETGNATDVQATPDPLIIVNMSVWTNTEALFAYVYRSGHAAEMSRRHAYFERFEGAYQALWWVQKGHQPTVAEGLSRLWMIDRFGSSPFAFTFKARFAEPGHIE